MTNKNDVITHDGHKAQERPKTVLFENTRYEVVESESLYIATGIESTSPVRRGFRVRCKGGTRFELELTDGVGWTVKALRGPELVSD